MSGESFSDTEQLKTIVTRDAPLLLALTPTDYEDFVGYGDDEWTAGMLLRCVTLVHELFEYDRNCEKAKKCFAVIGHPDIKMLVASKFLVLNEDTPGMTRLLKDALTSPEKYMLIASRDRNYDILREEFKKRHGKLEIP